MKIAAILIVTLMCVMATSACWYDPATGELVKGRRQSQPVTCEKGMAGKGYDARIPIEVLDSKEALCDTETNGGGWIIIQRRTKLDVDFYRGWEDYKNGFGSITTDYWLGLEAIHTLTTTGQCELRVDLTQKGKNYYAQYSTFEVGDQASNYKLKVGGYTGDIADNLSWNSGMRFTTKDRDNDAGYYNCAVLYRGAWWYYACGNSLNMSDAPKWSDNELDPYMDSSEMKIRCH